MQNIKNCVIYARQSFGSEVESTSINVQLEECRKWASSHNVKVVAEFSDYSVSSELYPYCESGVEACRVDRGFQMWLKEQRTKGRKQYKEGLGQAFDFIQKNRPSYIVVYTGNRLGRSATNSNLNNFMTAFLMEHNCSIVDVQSNSITDFSDKLMMAFRAMKDALDYQSVAEKRRASMESVRKRKDDHRVWSNAYGVVMVNGQVTFDPAARDVIRYVFDAFSKGVSYNGMLKHLNLVYKPLVKGRQWYSTNIRHILDNPVYAGFSRDSEGFIGKAVNVAEPVVSFSQWSECQSLRKERKSQYVAYNVDGGGKHWLPYSGLLHCSCGRRMQMLLDRGLVYRCLNEGEHVTRLRIDDNFLKSIQSLFALHVVESRRQMESMKRISVEIDCLVSDIARAEKELKVLYDAIHDDDDLAMLKDRIDAGKANIRNLKTKLADARAKQSMDLAEMEEGIDRDWNMLVEDRLDHETYRRLLWRTVENIIVHDDRLDIGLTGGIRFSIPRVTVDGRGRKMLPHSTVYASAENMGSLDSITHYHVVFGEGSHEEVLFEDDRLTISLKK